MVKTEEFGKDVIHFIAFLLSECNSLNEQNIQKTRLVLFTKETNSKYKVLYKIRIAYYIPLKLGLSMKIIITCVVLFTNKKL